MLNEKEMFERIMKEATYIIDSGATIRQTAQYFGTPKTTVHTDVTERLFEIDRDTYIKVRKVIDFNASQRAFRGGNAMKRKYKK